MSFLNSHEVNKQVYLTLFGTKSTPPLKVDNTGGKGPGQDGWESLDDVAEGSVQASKLEAATRREQERRHAADMENEGPIQRTKRYIADAEAARTTRRWPDSGVAIPSKPSKPDYEAAFKKGMDAVAKLQAEASSNVIYPREDGETVQPIKRIHEVSLSDDFERSSIDDDQNDWGGLTDLRQTLTDLGVINDDEKINRDEIGPKANKYGPGNYPTDLAEGKSYRSQGFYESIFADKAPKPFSWLIPNYIAAGPHPIATSHLDDFSVLKKAGFKAIVSVHEHPLNAKHLDGFQYLHVPTNEGFSGDLAKICKFIEHQMLMNNPVFIHSFQGKGRAATVLAAYLIHTNWVAGANEAIKYIRQYYDKDAIETAYQEAALQKFVLE